MDYPEQDGALAQRQSKEDCSTLDAMMKSAEEGHRRYVGIHGGNVMHTLHSLKTIFAVQEAVDSQTGDLVSKPARAPKLAPL